MQIHYLWINKSHYLKNASINLSSRFIFEMEKLNSGLDDQLRALTIFENPDYIPDFFEKSNVSNVTAIIGKNGAGKSSILKYIRGHLPDGIATDFHEDIIAYETEEDNKAVFHLLFPDHLELVINDKTKLFTIQPFGAIAINSLRFTGLPVADYIHYSYFLEYNEDLKNYSGLINISTTAYLAAARTRLIEEYLGNTNIQSQLLAKTSDLQNLYLDEVARAIQFLGSEDSKRLPFERPTELTVEISLDDSIYFRESNNKDHETSNLVQLLHKMQYSESEEEALISRLLIAIFINFQIDEKKNSVNNPSTYQVSLNDGEPVRKYLLRFFKEMKEYKVRTENDAVKITRYELLSVLVPEFIEFMDGLLKRNIIKISAARGAQFNLPLKAETEEIFQRLRDYYLKIKGVRTFFNFQWRSLSTGEQSYLSFMSRFHHIKHHEHHKLQRNLVIMIDEGDACYHPEWQRRFFKLTLDYLSRLFAEHSIQLIFTANTPFLSSDLPKSNVLFIEKRGKRSLYHSKANNRIETFAANIHTLYSDSFYMDGILIGEFAKNKLDKIIKYLNNKEATNRNEDYLKTIQLIGEPVLRRKLLDMWGEKFGLNEERLRLEERLAEINKQIQENNKGTDND